MFVLRPPNVVIMDKPWYRYFFEGSPTQDLETTKAKANTGDASSQFSLGLKYASGAGEAQDFAQAAHWFLKAADQSHSLAQFNLGVLYATGRGVPRDDTQATTWFQKAARQGNAGAQFNLGMSHYRASLEGLPTDAPESRIEAYKWFHLADAQGYKGSASARESVNLNMTREEVADGNQRVATFAVTGSNPS